MQLQANTVYTHTFESVNTETGTLKGVLMVSEGEAKGHGVLLNKSFIQDVVSLAKKQTNGVKARFGHPNMCTTALGTYLGVYKNVRLRKEKAEGKTRYHAIGDLHLSESAKETPNGNLYRYVLNLATERADMFGSSIAFEGDSYEKEEKDENGNTIINRYATINKLFATDLVDDPAATDGLFSENDFAANVTTFLDNNPRIFELVTKKPELIDVFLNKYKEYNMFKINLGKQKTFKKVATKEGVEFLYEGELKEGSQLATIDSDLEAGEFSTDNFKFEIDDSGKVVSFEVIEKTEPAIKEVEVKEMFEAFKAEFTKEITDSLNTSLNDILTPIFEKQAEIEAKYEAVRKAGSKGEPAKVEGVQSTYSTENVISKIEQLRQERQKEYQKSKLK